MDTGRGIQDLVEKIDKYIQILADPDLSFMKVYQNKALELKKKIQHREVIIPLIGEFSCGKSSLINALLGKDLLPVDVTPTTAVINEIRFSRRDEFIEVEYRDGRVERIPFTSDLRGLNNSFVRRIKIYSSMSSIPQNIVIVDTPGLSSLIEEHEEVLKEYVPESDAILLVVDVNQGTLTKTTISFVEYTNLIDKEIYVILTKADTKSEGEIKEIKEYLKVNYPMLSGIYVTSAKLKLLDEFYSLIDQINKNTFEILRKSGIRRFSELCMVTQDFLNNHLLNLSLDLRELDIKTMEIEKEISALESELEKKLNELRNAIVEAKEYAIDKFEKNMESKLNYLTDTFFNNPDELQSKFDEEIRKSAEEALRIFSRALKVKFSQFAAEIGEFRFSENVSSSLNYIIKGTSEIVTVVLLDLLIPGGVLYALVGNIIIKILSKIPQIGTVFRAYGEIITQLLSKVGQQIFRGYVRNMLKKAISKAKEDFSTHLETEVMLVLDELESKIKAEISSVINAQKESIDKLKEEKKKKIEEFNNYRDKIKTTLESLRLLCL